MSDSITELEPLLGDRHGRIRILVLGNSGSGKTTTGARLAEKLGIPHIQLDHVHWKPGWKATPSAEFKEKICKLLDNTGGSWVVDGDYSRKIGSVVFDDATDIIWLDPPLLLYFPRLLLRTFMRIISREDQCSPGCEERASEALFSRDSILLWCLTHHFSTRRKNLARMAEIGIGVGSNSERRRMRRLGGWGKDYNDWLVRVDDWVLARKRE